MLPVSPLEAIEPRLRPYLPADLYAAAWVDPSPTTPSVKEFLTA
jgi:hypothetical protein